jgi:hypothetical protein
MAWGTSELAFRVKSAARRRNTLGRAPTFSWMQKSPGDNHQIMHVDTSHVHNALWVVDLHVLVNAGQQESKRRQASTTFFARFCETQQLHCAHTDRVCCNNARNARTGVCLNKKQVPCAQYGKRVRFPSSCRSPSAMGASGCLPRVVVSCGRP